MDPLEFNFEYLEGAPVPDMRPTVEALCTRLADPQVGRFRHYTFHVLRGRMEPVISSGYRFADGSIWIAWNLG